MPDRDDSPKITYLVFRALLRNEFVPLPEDDSLFNKCKEILAIRVRVNVGFLKPDLTRDALNALIDETFQLLVEKCGQNTIWLHVDVLIQDCVREAIDRQRDARS